MTKMKRLFSLALALALSLWLSVPAFAAETAANIQLTKTTGTVTVTKSNGKAVSIRADMRLYNGYNVTTAEKSYAWINLDSTKLMKLDASSSVEVRKNGSKLEVNVKSGSVSFDVSEKLGSGESLNVSTSTMAVGIRGTCGWVSVNDQWVSEVCILEGSSQCVVMDPVTNQLKSALLVGGDMARCVVYPQDKAGDKCDILMERQTTEGIPGFVLTELVQDVALCDKILDDSGLDVLADLAKTAGGDPSGRTPDGKSASPEVLGQAKRAQAGEEAQAAHKLEEIRKEEESQERNISKDPVWEQGERPGTPSGSGSSSTGPSSTGPYTVTFDYGDGTTETKTTNAGNKLDSLPDGPDSFDGDGAFEWFTQAEGGDEVTTDTVFASNQTVYARWNGSWMFNKATGHLTIFSDAGMKSRTTNWGTYQNEIKTVEIRPGVTSIGPEAFSGCANLTGITLPDTVTSIGRSAFKDCSSLTGITIPASVKTIGSSAFSGGSSLKSVAFAEGSQLTSIGTSAFANCSALTGITIPNGVETIYGAFIGCTGLTDITIPGSVTDIGTAFSGCTGLKNAAIERGIQSIGDYAFDGCTGLTSAAIPDSVTSIGGAAFQNCTSLTRIDIPGSVTTIAGAAFQNCSGLKIIYFDNERTEWNKIGYTAPSGATVYCKGDVIVTFDLNGIPGVSDEPAPAIANADGKITLPEKPSSSDTKCYCYGWYTESTGGDHVGSETVFTENQTVYALWYSYKIEGTTVTFSGRGSMPDFPESPTPRSWNSCTEAVIGSGLTSVGYCAFEDCTSLTSVAIPDSVTRISLGAFAKCSSLTGVAIPDSVKSIGMSAFRDCASLTSITLPDSLTEIDTQAFMSTGLTGIAIPAGVTSIARSAFNDCKNLTSVTFAEDSKLTRIGEGAFSDCTSLTGIDIPDSVTSIGSSAFEGCKNLTSVTIGSGVQSIGYQVFDGCSSLTSVAIPDSVTSIGGAAFQNCSSLTSVTIGSGVQSIGDQVFNGCTSLAGITIPGSVTAIAGSAFQDCSGLKSIYFGNKRAVWNAFDYKAPDGVTVYCTDDIIVTFDLNDMPGVQNAPAPAIANAERKITLPEEPSGSEEHCYFQCWCTGQDDGEGVTAETVFTSSQTVYALWYYYKMEGSTVYIGARGRMFYYTNVRPRLWSECTNAVITDGSTSIGPYVFFGCEGLTNITIPDSVKSIDYGAFEGCTGLTSIELPNRVTSIGMYAFYGCTNLTSITIPVSMTKIESDAFRGCSSLTDINYRGTREQWENISGTSSIPDGIVHCIDDVTVTFDLNDMPGVSAAPAPAVAGDEGKITLPEEPSSSTAACYFDGWYTESTGGEQVTANTTFSENTTVYAHWRSYEVQGSTVTFSGRGRTSDFYNSRPPVWSTCTKAVISEGLTNIGSYLFFECSSLTSIEIPRSVTSIKSGAFEGCNSLKDVYFGGTKAEWDAVTKDSFTFMSDAATVHCTDGDIAD